MLHLLLHLLFQLNHCTPATYPLNSIVKQRNTLKHFQQENIPIIAISDITIYSLFQYKFKAIFLFHCFSKDKYI